METANEVLNELRLGIDLTDDAPDRERVKAITGLGNALTAMQRMAERGDGSFPPSQLRLAAYQILVIYETYLG